MQRPFYWLIALAFAAANIGCGGATQQRDIVVIVIDTLRPDRLGLYGAEVETAPFLASLAASSTVFHEAYSSSSWTAPSTASLLTGLYPPQHGVLEGMIVHRKRQTQADAPESAINRICAECPTLAERLSDIGYRNWAVSTNINIGDEIGFFRGFDRSQRLDAIKLDIHGNIPPANKGTRNSAPADRVLAVLRSWIDEEPNEAADLCMCISTTSTNPISNGPLGIDANPKSATTH